MTTPQRTIKTRRDGAGNLIADIYEAAPAAKTYDSGAGAARVAAESKRQLDALEADEKRMLDFDQAMRSPAAVASELLVQRGLLAAAKNLIAELIDRVASLEYKYSEIEQRGIHYRGVWQRAAEYKRGDIVTCNGSLWAGVVDNPRSMPGEGADWQLAIGSGVRSR